MTSAVLLGKTLTVASHVIDLSQCTAVKLLSQEDKASQMPYGIRICFANKDDEIIYGINPSSRKQWMAELKAVASL